MVQCRLGWVTRITIMSKYFKNMFSKLFAALFSMSLANRLVSVVLTSIFLKLTITFHSSVSDVLFQWR